MLTVYSKPLCPFCDAAEDYLRRYNFSYKKVNVMEDADALAFIKSKGHKTVPQIYYNEDLLVEGGYTGLKALQPNELDERIQKYVNPE